MITLTNREQKILKIIVEQYSRNAVPVSSNEIINFFDPPLSSATIRIEMGKLEKKKLLEKTHLSSGRIPSLDGYKYYCDYILTPKINLDLKKKLKLIFDNRELSINTIIDQTTSILNENFKLPLLLTVESNETLKRFDLIRLSDTNALIIIIVSSGNIIKNNISIINQKQFDDIMICVRVFNDRLVDTPISQINEKLEHVKEIIRSIVNEYEFCFQKIIMRIFDANIITRQTKLVGTKYIASQPEFKNLQKLNHVLEFLDNVSIWKQLAYLQNSNNKTSITFAEEIGDRELAIACTSIALNNGAKHHIAVVGPTRMEFDLIKGVLDFIKEELEKLNNNK